MKKILLPALIGVCLPLLLPAQQPAAKNTGCGCSFSSINQVGLTEGKAGTSFLVQSINGLRYRTWFAGVGVGLDHYRYRTVPLFFDVRKDLFGKKHNTPFIYADIGTNFAWLSDKQQENFWGTNEYSNGLYYDAGLGYKLNVGKGRGLLFSGGFSLKKFRETRHYSVVCITAPCPESYERFDFTLRRVSVKAAIQF